MTTLLEISRFLGRTSIVLGSLSLGGFVHNLKERTMLLWKHMRLVLLISLGFLVCITASSSDVEIPSSGIGYLPSSSSSGSETFTSSISGGIEVGADVEVIQGGVQVNGNQQWTKTWDTYTASLSTTRSSKTAKSIFLDFFSGALINEGVERCVARGEAMEINYTIVKKIRLLFP